MENEAIIIIDQKAQALELHFLRQFKLPPDEHGKVFALHVIKNGFIIVIAVAESGFSGLPARLPRIEGKPGP